LGRGPLYFQGLLHPAEVREEVIQMTTETAAPKEQNAKAVAQAALKDLPDDATLNQVLDAIEMRGKILRGLQEAAEGKGLTEDEARARLKKWCK